jgi:hypothetical protein
MWMHHCVVSPSVGVGIRKTSIPQSNNSCSHRISLPRTDGSFAHDKIYSDHDRQRGRRRVLTAMSGSSDRSPTIQPNLLNHGYWSFCKDHENFQCHCMASASDLAVVICSSSRRLAPYMCHIQLLQSPPGCMVGEILVEREPEIRAFLPCRACIADGVAALPRRAGPITAQDPLNSSAAPDGGIDQSRPASAYRLLKCCRLKHLERKQ